MFWIGLTMVSLNSQVTVAENIAGSESSVAKVKWLSLI